MAVGAECGNSLLQEYYIMTDNKEMFKSIIGGLGVLQPLHIPLYYI